MELSIFILFLVFSHIGMLIIFRFSTYFRYFWKSVPILTFYSICVAYGLTLLDLINFAALQIAIVSTYLGYRWWRREKLVKELVGRVKGDPAMESILGSATKNSNIFFLASSIIYVFGLIISVVIFAA